MASTTNKVSSLDKLLAFGFGVAFLLIILGLFFFGDDLSPQQFFAARVVLALAAGAIGAVIPGFLQVDVPGVRAGGALALVVLVYWFNPPSLIANPPFKRLDNATLGVAQARFNAESGATFALTFEPAQEGDLREFWVGTMAGQDWAEVFSKICKTYGCLTCTPPPDAILSGVRIGVGEGGLSTREINGRERVSCP